MNTELMITTSIQVIVGILGIALGTDIAKNKKIEWIATLNKEKYNKNELCSIVGHNVVLLGILTIVYSAIHFIAYDYIKNTPIYAIINMITVVSIIINVLYKSNKYAKI